MQGQRVLLVEDDFIINLGLRDFLNDSGYQVEAVYCAAAALEQLNRGRQLCALVSDIELGVGEDGFAVARHARAAYPGLPVVFISATSAARHAREGVAGSAFIDKPLNPSQVLAALAWVMAQGGGAIKPPGNGEPDHAFSGAVVTA